MVAHEEILSPKRERCSVVKNKKPHRIRGCGRETNSSGCSRFPTLVLPRSGSEGRPFGRTLSRVAPLASGQNRIAGLMLCQRGIRPSRMLKKSASGVLAALRGSTYRSVRLASSLAAALLDSLFEHPAWCFPVVPGMRTSEMLAYSHSCFAACFIDCRETLT